MPGDVESGGINNPESRWSFIQKVYSITTFQLLLTIAVVSVDLFVHPIANFFNSQDGIAIHVELVLIHLTSLCLPPTWYYPQNPLRYFLLLFINVSSALAVGLTFVFACGKISLEIVILITIMMFLMTLYTFWAAKRGHGLSLLLPFLFGSLSILFFLSFIQILFLPSGIPLEKLVLHNFGCLVSIMFCGFIVYYTNYLIKNITYDQHIDAFVILHGFVLITFFIPLLILRYAFCWLN